jgi:hypothetical protein
MSVFGEINAMHGWWCGVKGIVDNWWTHIENLIYFFSSTSFTLLTMPVAPQDSHFQHNSHHVRHMWHSARRYEHSQFQQFSICSSVRHWEWKFLTMKLASNIFLISWWVVHRRGLCEYVHRAWMPIDGMHISNEEEGIVVQMVVQVNWSCLTSGKHW